MNFSERPSSKQWAALNFGGEKIAEVWFKPEGEPWALRFRIPQNSFHIPGVGPRLTPENLVKAVAIAPEEVESWRHGDVFHSGLNGPTPQLRNPLPQPPPDVPHLEIDVHLKPPAQAIGPTESGQPETALAKRQEFEARWKAFLGLEATIETLRISMEGLRAELEAALQRGLTPDEKLHALAADVSPWTKAKSRLHHALPKTREFIHRATWAKGTPERKKLDELFKNPTGIAMPVPQMDQVLDELEGLRKDRQILSGQGVTVYQECKTISAEVQGALTRLQSNAAARSSKKKAETRTKGKSI